MVGLLQDEAKQGKINAARSDADARRSRAFPDANFLHGRQPIAGLARRSRPPLDGGPMQLNPVLGLPQLIFYAVGVIIGAGIYSVIGGAAGIAREGLWLSFVIGAVVALLTGFSYAEMATTFPIAGAEYIYVRRAMPGADWAAFGMGALMLLGGGATAATVAVAFGGYLRTFVDVPVIVSALGLIVICTAINIWGIQESSWANILFTLIEVGGLLFIVTAALVSGNVSAPVSVEATPGVMAAAAILFFVYLGFEELAHVAEEARNPGRDLPLAIFGGLAITTVLYVLVSLAVVSLAPPEKLAASQAPLSTALQEIWPRAGSAMSAIALFATANTVLITLVAVSRLAFSMGRDGELPAAFARLLPRRRSPWLGALLAFIAAAILLPVGDLTVLAGLSSFAALIAFLTVNVTLIVLRYREPDRPRPFRVPFSIGRLPLLPVAAIVSILILIAYFDLEVVIGGAIGLALSAVAYLLRRWWQRANRSA